MSYLLPISLLTLFTAVKISAGIVLLRPFDAVVIVMLMVIVTTPLSGHRVRSTGFLVLLPFFAWHVISAFTLGVENGVRELLQVALMMGFAAALMLSVDRLDYRAAGWVMVAGLAFVLGYTIIWHVFNGHWIGWKHLNNPKAVFGYLPMALGCLLLFAAPAQRRMYWLLWWALPVVIILSTERKALIIYGILTAMFLVRGRILAALPTIGLGALILIAIINIFSADDFTRQLRTLLNPIEAGGSEAMVARGVTPESLSNAQRTFSFNVAGSYFKEAPLTGIGTNGYFERVGHDYAYLPSFMRLSIHNEFLRVATENGIIGLALYLTIWSSAWMRLRHRLSYLRRTGQMTMAQTSILPFVLMTAPFMYLAFDASGTPSFAVLIIVAFMPDLAFAALRQRSEKMVAHPDNIHAGAPRLDAEPLAVE